VGTGNVVVIVLVLVGQINFAITLDLSLPTSGVKPSYRAMEERRNGPSCLCDDDDDDNNE